MSKWPAPAKLNLFLHITGQRDDGYHLLQTAFQFLDWSDQLHFESNTTGQLTLRSPQLDIKPENNLVLRAAKALKEFTGCELGADIALDKRLPMGGGLGGGSSDAATTLVALNQIWRCELSLHTLAEIGLKLGADVPVFVMGHAAWAEGVGEELTAFTPPTAWYLVVDPGVHVSTAEIFSDPELTRDSKIITISSFLSGEVSNVCQVVVEKRYPAVAAAAKWLSQFGKPELTGTGGCIFVSFKTETEANRVKQHLPELWQGFVARGLNISPLHQSAVLQE